MRFADVSGISEGDTPKVGNASATPGNTKGILFQVLLGLLAFAIVAAQIVTGSVMITLFDIIRRDKAPRAFWTLNVLMGGGAAYLIYRGVSH